jgi:gluconate 5-dehydrogenase
MNPFDLSGKLALVTGATRGIGLGVARAMAECGAGIILVGRDEFYLNQAAVELRKLSDSVNVASFDLLQTGKISSWFEQISTDCGSPDILVNSAGINRRGTAIDLSLDDWNEVIAVNTTAVFELCRSFARVRVAEAKGGRIINIASLMTAAARPGVSPYTASKGAVGQLTKALAVEWAQAGILVNAIAPGYIQTDLNKSLMADTSFDQWVKGRCPLGRWGTPEDIAWPAVFLASSAAGFITGQVIYVDGGWLATF